MSLVTYTYRAGDQPMTCPRCGVRTDWVDVQLNRYSPPTQQHTCLGRNCGYTFLMVEDNE